MPINTVTNKINRIVEEQMTDEQIETALFCKLSEPQNHGHDYQDPEPYKRCHCGEECGVDESRRHECSGPTASVDTDGEEEVHRCTVHAKEYWGY